MKLKIQVLLVVVMLYFVGGLQPLKSSSFEFVSKNEVVSGDINDEIRAKAEIRNISANVVNVKAKMEILSLKQGHSIVFCWDICYPPKDNDFTSEGHLTLMPLGTSGENFHADVFADGITGESKVKFTFFDANNPEDNISFTVTFLVGMTGVESFISEVDYTLSEPTPNPASKASFIEYKINKLFTGARIRFFNLKGEEILNQPLMSSNGKISLNIPELTQGIYFYHLEVDGLISETKKFVLIR